MPAAVVAAAFQHIQESNNVCVDVGMGIEKRMTYAGLCRQMRYRRELVDSEKIRRAPAVGEIDWLKLKIGERLEPIKPRLLQGGMVVVAEIVQADNVTAKSREPVRNMRTDE